MFIVFCRKTRRFLIFFVDFERYCCAKKKDIYIIKTYFLLYEYMSNACNTNKYNICTNDA